MTNSAVSQWEVAGAKKTSTQRLSELSTKTTQQKTGITTRKSVASKIPVVETLKPLKQENGYYDYLAPSDDDDEPKQIKAKKSPKSESKDPAKSLPVSPKSKKDETKSKRKSVPLSPGKQIKNDLDTAISQLNFDSFQQKHAQLESLFPDNQSLVCMHMAAFLNQSLNDLPDVEPNSMHDNESSMYPSNKLERKLEKLLTNLIFKLKRSDAEYVFDYCMNEIVKNDNPKVVSNHGLRIFIQMLLKHNQSILMSNLARTCDLIHTNRHRHQRILLALWSISQVGYHNLTNGLTIWFEVMLPLQSTKQFTIYVNTYLHALFQHHKIDAKTIASKLNNQYIITLDQYQKMYEIATESSIQNKEACLRLKSSFALVRSLFLSNLEFSPETGPIFENLLSNLNMVVEDGGRYSDCLEILAKCLFTNTDAMKMWEAIYLKNVKQSTILIEYLTLNCNRQLRALPNMREMLMKFDFDTDSVLNVAAAVSPQKETEKETKKPYYINKKAKQSTNNTAELESFNKLVKTTLKKDFKRTSFISRMFRAFFTFILFSGMFLYWDQTQNKSIYFKSAQKQLAKYGLLDDATLIVETARKSILDAQKSIQYNVPIWYKKTCDTVLPYTNKAWDQSVEYSKLAWKNTEELRKQADVHYQQARKYVEVNLPVVKKALKVYGELAVEYGLRAYENGNVWMTQMLGWKEGELEKVFVDAFVVMNEHVYAGVDWVTKSLKNLTAQ